MPPRNATDGAQLSDPALASTSTEPTFSETRDILLIDILNEPRIRSLPIAFVESIQRFGVLTPVTVRELPRTGPSPRYALLHGRRRYEAMRRLSNAGLSIIPARVVTNYDALPHATTASLTVAENVHHDPSIEALCHAIATANQAYPTIAECAHAFGMSVRAVQVHLLMALLPPHPWWDAYRAGRTDATVLRRAASGNYSPRALADIRVRLERGICVSAREARAIERLFAGVVPTAVQTTFVAADAPDPPPTADESIPSDGTGRLHIIANAADNFIAVNVNGGDYVNVSEVFVSERGETAPPLRVATYRIERGNLVIERNTGADVPTPRRARRARAARVFDPVALDAMLARGALDEWTRIIDVLALVRSAHPTEPDNDHDAFANILDALVERARRILTERTAGATEVNGALDDEDEDAMVEAPARPPRTPRRQRPPRPPSN